MQTISVKCKLQVPVGLRTEIDRTLQGFANACNQVYKIAKRENCWNTTKLHHLVYKPVKASTELKANHVCQAIRRVISNAKTVKQIHKFRPTSINLDVRTFQYIEELQTVGVTLMGGRVKFKLSIGNYQLALLKGQSPTAATLSKTKQGDYYINICVNLPIEPTGKTPKVIGVDLGRRDIATTSTGKAWNGKQIESVRDRYNRVRAFSVPDSRYLHEGSAFYALKSEYECDPEDFIEKPFMGSQKEWLMTEEKELEVINFVNRLCDAIEKVRLEK